MLGELRDAVLPSNGLRGWTLYGTRREAKGALALVRPITEYEGLIKGGTANYYNINLLYEAVVVHPETNQATRRCRRRSPHSH